MALLPESVFEFKIFRFLNCSWEPLEILGSGLFRPPRNEGAWLSGVVFPLLAEAGC